MTDTPPERNPQLVIRVYAQELLHDGRRSAYFAAQVPFEARPGAELQRLTVSLAGEEDEFSTPFHTVNFGSDVDPIIMSAVAGPEYVVIRRHTLMALLRRKRLPNRRWLTARREAIARLQ